MRAPNVFFIVLACHRPNLEFLSAQIESIRGQTDPEFRCLVQDDASPPELTGQIRALFGDDPRFSLRRNERRLGVFHNFEQGLRETPAHAALICYCDQDDIWLPSKLERQRAALLDPRVSLCHTDLEIIDEQGRLLHPSCFEFEKRNVLDYSLAQLLMRNSVTGCTAAFRSSLLPRLLPFPFQGSSPRYHHDLWTALQATQVGNIVALREPLVRYRQHGANVIGAESGQTGPRSFLSDLALHAPKDPKAYAEALENEWLLRRELIQELLQRAVHPVRPEARIDDLVNWTQRKAGSLYLGHFVASHSHRGDSLAAIAPRVLAGKLCNGVRRVPPDLVRMAREPIRLARAALDRLDGLLPAGSTHEERSLGRPGAPLFWPLPMRPNQATAPSWNLVIPSLQERHLFGGTATALHLAAALMKRGLMVRCVVTECALARGDIERTRGRLTSAYGLSPERAREIVFVDGVKGSRSGMELSVSPHDSFIATAWWTAARVLETLRLGGFLRRRFIYLIQDFEPGFYPWSVDYAQALSTYEADHLPIYNSTFLAEYFRTHVRAPVHEGLILAPQVEWERYLPPTREELARRTGCRILVYGRPGTPRNLFPLLVRGLSRWLESIQLLGRRGGLEVVAAGEPFPPMSLVPGVTLRSLGKLDLEHYASELRRADIGVSLMLSPHPSYPPLEMAAAGLATVTNRFANKDLASCCETLLTCSPSEESLVDALRRAYEVARDPERRLAGAAQIRRASLGLPLEQVVDTLVREIETDGG